MHSTLLHIVHVGYKDKMIITFEKKLKYLTLRGHNWVGAFFP